MINKYSKSFLLSYRLIWLAFLLLVVVPLISYGSQMTGMHMAEKVTIYQAFVGKHLAYVYWFLGEIIPDAAYSIVMLSGMLLPEFAVYFFCIFIAFVEPPFFRKMREAQVRETVADVIELSS